MDLFNKFNIILACLVLKSQSVNNFWLSKNIYSFRSDSDAFLNSSQLLQKYNYNSQSYIVETEDGYKLNIFRIPRRGPPVLLVHGIGDSSDCWLVLGPKHSLAYQLADFGYDVWLFNARGNRYSKKHRNKLPPKEFWDFSYEEIGSRDLPATVDFILSETERAKLTYIGFSQGTTVFFVMCAVRPEYNEKIDHAIVLAPVAWLQRMKYPLINFFSQNLKAIKSFSENENVFEVFPFNEKLNLYHISVCDIKSPLRILCELELFINFGLKNIKNLLSDKLPVISSHIPAGSSAKLFFHFIQGYTSQGFRRYDYGRKENMVKYLSPVPPLYDVSLIKVPITLFASEVDWFSDSEDVQILLSKLTTVNKFIFINETVQFTHLEFVYGSRVNLYINKQVLNILQRN